MSKRWQAVLIVVLIIAGAFLVFSRADNTSNKLYDVLKDAVEEGDAKEYTGEHQDSLDNSGTEKIYYWYGTNTVMIGGNLFLDKISVKLGDTCWQTIRTTDTGGVKMIYNGPYDETNKCNTSRGNHKGVIGVYGTTKALNGTYQYGDSYTYDETTGIFTLTNPTTATWSDSTYQNLLGKYTCASASNTCTTLYNVNSYSDSTTAYTTSYTIGDTRYPQIGTSSFNANRYSPAMVGYMFNVVYKYKYKDATSTENTLSSSSLGTTYWYADGVTWGSPTANRYNLDNPDQVSSTSDYPNLVGKYTFRNTSQTYTNTSVYYIAAVSGSTMYYIQLTNSGNHTLSEFNYTYTYGDGYTDNGNGTYTINNPTTINRSDWYSNYNNVKNKYVCKNATNNTCNDLWYATATTNTSMTYLNPITNNYKYANGFEYRLDPDDNTYKYFLNNDSVTFFNISDSTNKTSLNTHHYTCWNTSGECAVLSYVYNVSSSARISYIDLTDGKSIEEVKNEMLYNNDVNRYNSSIKGYIEAWYHQNMTDYTEYLEDTVFCNDRTEDNASTNGWNPNGGKVSTDMWFVSYSSSNTNLKCNNVTDQFSLTNPKATLAYPVGLATSQEMNLLNASARRSVSTYWYLSPSRFPSQAVNDYYVANGGTSLSAVHYAGAVRPVVSLKPGTKYTTGDGSMNNPYVIAIKPKITTSVTNGTITETSSVEEGSNKTIKYKPNSGYVIDSILVDGVAVSTSDYKSRYTFTNVTTDHTISVVYRQGTTADFDQGLYVNAKMKTLAAGSSKSDSSVDTLITSIKRASTLPSGFTPSTENTVSTNNSPYPIYIFFDDSDGTMYYYSEADIVYLNSNSSNMFKRFKGLTDISGLSEIDTSKLSNASSMFYECTSLASINDLSDWDTSNVTNMYNLFYGCSDLTNISALSNWDTSNVTNMGQMFYQCKIVNLDALADWDTSSVTNMSGAFYGCKMTNIDALSDWDTSKVQRMGSIFQNCNLLTNLDGVSDWDTSSVLYMDSLASGCTDLTNIDGISEWDTSKVTTMSNAFASCRALTNINALDDWNTSKVTNMTEMFEGCSSLTNIDGTSNWDTSSVTNISNIFNGATKASGTFPILGNPTSYANAFNNAATNSGSQITVIYNCIKTTNIDAIIATKSSDSNVVKGSCITTSATFDTGSVVNVKMKNLANNSSSMTTGSQDTVIQAIKRSNTLPNGFTPTTENTISTSTSEKPIYIYFDDSDGTMYYYSEADKVYLNSNSSDLCADLGELSNISGLSEVDTSNVTRMGNMFRRTNITNIDALANWDTSNVTSMYRMLYKIGPSLTDIDGASNWDVSHVTSMADMFGGCNALTNIDALENWDTSNVTSMSGMFTLCTSLEDIDGASNWDTSKVTNISNIFNGCSNASGTFPILGNPTNYTDAFTDAATESGSQITVVYNCTETTNIDAIIATKSSDSNVVKGSCILTNVDVTVTNEVYGNMASVNKDFSYTVTVRNNNDVAVPELGTTFTLKNDESEVLSIPVGYSITVTQDSETGYDTTVNDTNSRTITKTITDDDTITYKNTYNISPATGTVTILTPYILLLILSILTTFGIVCARKRIE